MINNKEYNSQITHQNHSQDNDNHLQSRLQQLLKDLQLDDAPAGGALVVYQAGICIAQASVGLARTDLAWGIDTLSLNFSTGKGILATLVHVLVSQKKLDYDLPIAHYWPAFAAHHKGEITLRSVMSHQADLFSIQSIDIDNQTVLDWSVMLEKIAAMPVTAPEQADLYDSAYSALVYGWVLGGAIEAVTTMTLAEALRYYLTEPLGIADSCYFGVPDNQIDKVARLVKNFKSAEDAIENAHENAQPQPRSRRHKPVLTPDSANTLQTYRHLPSYGCWQQQAANQSVSQLKAADNNNAAAETLPALDTAQINRLYFDNSQLNLKNYKAALLLASKEPIDYYHPQTLQASIPAANGVASAQALATIYAMLANRGVWQGKTLIDEAIFKQLSTPQVTGMDAVMPAHMDWRLGYHRRFSICQNNRIDITADTTQDDMPEAFGHMGYNGSVAWCDPERQLSFAFIHNFDVTMLNDIRQFALTESVLSLIDAKH